MLFRSQAGDTAARDILLENNLGFIRKIALEQYRSMGLDENDIGIDLEGTTNTNMPNLTLIKRRLSPKEELPKADMIIGFMPCEGTETAIHLSLIHI